MYRWNNVPGICVVEIIGDTNVDEVLLYEGDEVTIHFESSGYEMQSSMYGGPDNLGWPAERDEERIVTKVVINGKTEIQPCFYQQFQEEFDYEINEAKCGHA